MASRTQSRASTKKLKCDSRENKATPEDTASTENAKGPDLGVAKAIDSLDFTQVLIQGNNQKS
jgi:hypothetical protein